MFFFCSRLLNPDYHCIICTTTKGRQNHGRTTQTGDQHTSAERQQHLSDRESRTAVQKAGSPRMAEDIAEFMREDWKEKDTYTGEILVQVLFVVPNRRRWDVDNRLKALLDCLQIAGVIKDDSQIAGITAERRRGDTVKTLIAVHEYNGAMELYKESWEFLTAWGREESHEK